MTDDIDTIRALLEAIAQASPNENLSRDLAEALAALERVEAGQWRPASEAPKTFGVMLLAYRQDQGCFLIRWDTAAGLMTELEIEALDMSEAEYNEFMEPDWFVADFRYEGDRLTEGFTHWMPLPKEPSDD